MTRVGYWLSAILALGGLATGRAGTVVMSEIMYHPPAGLPEYVVLYNHTATPLDIADWRLTGGVSYSFAEFSTKSPESTFLKAFERIILSSAGERATREAYDLPPDIRVFGPWSGKLDNAGERITLEDKNGVVACSVKYRSKNHWSPAANGAGHSLVLKDPNRAVDNWRNWTISSHSRPKPGRAAEDAPVDSPLRLSEVHFHEKDSMDWVELHNASSAPVLLDGSFLACRADFSSQVALAGQIPAHGYRSWPVAFPFHHQECPVFLVSSANDVLDSRVFQLPGIGEDWQVFPDGAREWYASSVTTRDAPNHPPHETNIVINEIMFDPPSHLGIGEYVELFNRGPSEVDLSGWQLEEGIHFTFPPESKLTPGGYLVVAQNADQMREIYGAIPVVGNFQGHLGNRGELLRLVDSRGNLANEVDYQVGGNWPRLAGGGGSSLELVNPRMDNRWPSAWRDSDEGHKSQLATFSCTNTYLQRKAEGKPSDYQELHFHLVGQGQAILENIALMAGRTNLIRHGDRLSTNGSGESGWVCQGNHWASFVTNSQLHLLAEGHGDNRPNHVEIDLPGLQINETYHLKFNARWVSGKPRLIAQSWDHSLGASFLLEVPRNLGTPGRINSRFSPEPIPQLDGLSHFPAVPRSTDVVQVAVRVASSVPLASVELFHRADTASGTARWASLAMSDDGRHGGDALAGDGVYSAQLDAYQTSGQIAQFFVQALTREGAAVTLPLEGPARPALFVVDDQAIPHGLRTARLVVSAQAKREMAEGNSAKPGVPFPLLSNHYYNMTFISNEREIYYGAAVRSSGSPLTRTTDLHRVKFKLPPDRPFRGRTKFSLDDDAAEGRAYHNRVVRYLLYLLGHPVNENEFIRLVVNAGQPALREDTEPVEEEFLDRNFAKGRKGELYRMDDEWWFLDDGSGLNQDAEWSYQGADPSHYRTAWLKRTRETEDDFSRLIGFFKLVSQTNANETEIDQLLDPVATLKVAAVRGYIGDWDNFTMQRGRNGFFYRRPSDGRFQLLHWDSDEGFITGQPLYGPRLKGWLEEPSRKRLFHAFLAEVARLVTREPLRFQTWLALEREATGGQVTQAAYLSWFKVRTPEVLAAMGASSNPAFRVFANQGVPLATRRAAISVGGLAPDEVTRVLVQGQPESRLRWVSDREWLCSGIRLQPGENHLTVKGLGPSGQVVHQETLVITQTR